MRALIRGLRVAGVVVVPSFRRIRQFEPLADALGVLRQPEP